MLLKDHSKVDIVNMTVTVKFENNVDVVLRIRRLLKSELRKRTGFTGPRDAILSQ